MSDTSLGYNHFTTLEDDFDAIDVTEGDRSESLLMGLDTFPDNDCSDALADDTSPEDITPDRHQWHVVI